MKCANPFKNHPTRIDKLARPSKTILEKWKPLIQEGDFLCSSCRTRCYTSKREEIVTQEKSEEWTEEIIDIPQNSANDSVFTIETTDDNYYTIVNQENAEDTSFSVTTKRDLKQMKKQMFTYIDSELNEIKSSIVNALKSDMFKLNMKLNNIESNVVEIKALIKNIEPVTNQITNENVITFEKFCEVHEYNLPINNLEDFINFDITITEDVYKDLKTYFKLIINRNCGLFSNCAIILIKFFTESLLMKDTTLKQFKNQENFKQTNFYACLKESLTEVLPSTSVIIKDEHLLNVIYSFIGNLKNTDIAVDSTKNEDQTM